MKPSEHLILISMNKTLTATVPTDKNGAIRTAHGMPDLGAYEYSSPTVPRPPLSLRIIQ
jgi:hypothetical protein